MAGRWAARLHRRTKADLVIRKNGQREKPAAQEDKSEEKLLFASWGGKKNL